MSSNSDQFFKAAAQRRSCWLIFAHFRERLRGRAWRQTSIHLQNGFAPGFAANEALDHFGGIAPIRFCADFAWSKLISGKLSQHRKLTVDTNAMFDMVTDIHRYQLRIRRIVFPSQQNTGGRCSCPEPLSPAHQRSDDAVRSNLFYQLLKKSLAGWNWAWFSR